MASAVLVTAWYTLDPATFSLDSGTWFVTKALATASTSLILHSTLSPVLTFHNQSASAHPRICQRKCCHGRLGFVKESVATADLECGLADESDGFELFCRDERDGTSSILCGTPSLLPLHFVHPGTPWCTIGSQKLIYPDACGSCCSGSHIGVPEFFGLLECLLAGTLMR